MLAVVPALEKGIDEWKPVSPKPALAPGESRHPSQAVVRVVDTKKGGS